MCDGSRFPRGVLESDSVLTRDERTGHFACRALEVPFTHPDKPIIALELEALSGEVERIDTANHPFYVEVRGWTRVDELEMGDAVVSSSGAPVTGVGLRWTGEVETV